MIMVTIILQVVTR